jgi:hypothetical protein
MPTSAVTLARSLAHIRPRISTPGIAMKAYLATTAALFVLLTVLHIVRATQETNLARDPWFLLVTVLAAALAVWALSLLRKTARPGAA